MSRQVEWAKRALKRISRTSQPMRGNILVAIDELAQKNQGDIRRLTGRGEGIYRLRVGGWRVVFSYLIDGTILIHRIGPRGDVYKK